MSEEIIKVIDELGKRFGIVIDWSNQNIIPYLQELLKRFICYRNITACVDNNINSNDNKWSCNV